MVELCFVLDLRSLPPPFLRDFKQSLLQLANLYAISPAPPAWRRSETLRDRIGLCFVFRNLVTSSDQLKIVYTPSPNGSFSLRDFHHAVKALPENAFQPSMDDSDVKLSSVVNDEVLLCRWEGRDIMRKVIVITSCLPREVDASMQRTLTAAADKCVSVEFLLFEQMSSHLSSVKENINSFVTCISELDNCSFQTCLADPRVLHGLVNRWLQDLKDDIEEPMLARFKFKQNLVGSVNQITCNLYASVNQIVDGFYPCQTCRCHGISLEDAVLVKTEGSCCPVTGRTIERSDVIDTSVKVGERTILFLPSLKSPVKRKRASSPIDFSIIERTNLGSLSEGVVMGASYIVIPSSFQETEASSDETDQSDVNTEVFQGICCALHSEDQGLVCCSNCNIETMTKATLHCYYILQPSNNGLMLIRRIAGSEELLHIPNLNQLAGSSVRKGFKDSVKDCLSRIDITDYNPLLHERGFHQKLNLLVEERLLLGSLPSTMEEDTYESNAAQPIFSEVIDEPAQTIEIKAIPEEPSIYADLTAEEEKTSTCITDEWEQLVVNDISKLRSPLCASKSKPDEPARTIEIKAIPEEPSVYVDLTAEEEKTSTCITYEWEQLVVNDISKLRSPLCTSKSKLDQQVQSPPEATRQLDAKTSSILERLEVPRQFRREPVSPNLTSKGVTNSRGPVKKPLLPSRPSCAPEKSTVSCSQLIKPNFQRLKRKFKQ